MKADTVMRVVLALALPIVVACGAPTAEEVASQSSMQELGECPSLRAHFCEESNGSPVVREYSIYGLRHEDGSCRYWGGTEEQVLATWPCWGPSYGDPTGAVEYCGNGCEAPTGLDARCF